MVFSGWLDGFFEGTDFPLEAFPVPGGHGRFEPSAPFLGGRDIAKQGNKPDLCPSC
jgi:hypothetical protein